MDIPIEYSVTDAKIAEIKEFCSGLTIGGLDDDAGYSVVKKARIRVKNLRIEVEHKRKELKADALKFGQAVDAEARRIKAELEPIENHLSEMEKKWEEDKEKARLREERLAMLPSRRERVSVFPGGENVTDDDLLEMTDQEFGQLLSDFEKIELQKEAERQRQEQERIDAEKARIQAERDAIEREKQLQARIAKEREEAVRRAKEEAEAELARVKAEAEAEKIRLEQEAKAKEEAARLAEQEAIRAKTENARLIAEAGLKAKQEEATKMPGDLSADLFGGMAKREVYKCPHCSEDISKMVRLWKRS